MLAAYSTLHECLALALERGPRAKNATEAHPLAIFYRVTDNGGSNRRMK